MSLRERLVASVTDIRGRGQRLVQLNLELLTSELKEKGRTFGAAIALFVGAGVLALYAVGFALATIAVALALVLPLWLSLLVVTLLLFALVAALVAVGRGQIERAQAPAPTAAAAEARASVDLVKGNVREIVAGVRARTSARRRATSRGFAGRGATPGDVSPATAQGSAGPVVAPPPPGATPEAAGAETSPPAPGPVAGATDELAAEAESGTEES